MKYKIYKMVGKDKLVRDGYETSTETYYKLKLADKWDSYDTYESAVKYVEENAEQLKGETIVILPTLEIDWQGKIC